MHPGSGRGTLNFCGGEGRRYAFERIQNVSLQFGSRIVPDHSLHKTLNQKLKGCDPQPFIVDMQASPR